MEMVAAKRKRPAEKGDAAEGRRKKGESSAVVAPTEEEVEEFFAILRRMQAAVKYLKKDKIDGRSHPHDPTALLKMEPVVGIDGGVDDGDKLKRERDLDLNATPPEDETESNDSA